MNKLNAVTNNTASEKSKILFGGIKNSIGILPNIYAVIGNSAVALESYLTFSELLKNCSFNAKEQEAIFLAVSESNGCNYCVSAHTALARMNGFSEEETLELRAGTIKDIRYNVLTNLAKSIVENRGRADEKLIDAFYEMGFKSDALVELVALVIEKSFTNYIGRLAKPEIDFPIAKTINT